MQNRLKENQQWPTGNYNSYKTFCLFQKRRPLILKKVMQMCNLPMIKTKEINATMSPDGNYVVYTKNNDLYTINIHTKKKQGSPMMEVTLSWMATPVGCIAKKYWEDLSYKTFGGAPTVRILLFFQNRRRPCSCLYDHWWNRPAWLCWNHALSQSGRQEPWVILKKSPESADGERSFWCDFNEKDDQYFGMPYWKPDGSSLLVQWMNRKQKQPYNLGK